VISNPNSTTREILQAEYRAYLVTYGYIGEKDPLSGGMVWNSQRKDYYHFLSSYTYGETYGYNEYDQIMPLKDYLESPTTIIEDILSGVASGRRRAKEEAAAAAKRAANKPGNNPTGQLPKELQKEMNK
jgi:hypothetical protein